MAGRGLRTVIKAHPMVCLLALMLGIKSRNDSTPIGRLSNYLAFTRSKALAILGERKQMKDYFHFSNSYSQVKLKKD